MVTDAEKGSVLPLNVAMWENGPWNRTGPIFDRELLHHMANPHTKNQVYVKYFLSYCVHIV
jgi:hypothetical protein